MYDRMTSTSIPAVGDVIGGRYKIQSVIASGGMGVVMRGQHVKMGREVAVKFLHAHLIQDTDIRQRFEREVDIAKDLTHPNVVHVYDYGETPAGNLYLVMEYLEGNDLKHVLKEERIMRQILDGLAEAHIRNVVHRDLKPANLFMTTDRHGNDLVKILDFGIAKSLQADQGITKAGTLCGTVAYMAPEAILAGGDTPSCDVYAAGLILLEMLTGKRAFRGETVAQTMMMQLQQNPFIPPRLDQSALGQLIRHATDKNPEGRVRDADGMLLALRQIINQIDPNLILTDDEVPLDESDAAPSRSDLYRPKPLPTIPIPTVVSKNAGAAAAGDAQNNDANTQHISLDEVEWDDGSNPGLLAKQSGLTPDDLRPTIQLAQPTPAQFLNQTPPPTATPRAQSTPHSSPSIPSLATQTDPRLSEPSSSSTSTALSHKAPDSKKPVFIAVAALLVVAAVVGGIVVTSGSKTSEPISEVPEIAPKPTEVAAIVAPKEEIIDEFVEEPTAPVDTVSEFSVDIQTTPGGADLFLDNFPLGSSPVTLKLKPDEMPAELRIVLEGYVEKTQRIDNTSADSLNILLEPVPTIPEVAKAEPKPKEAAVPAKAPTTKTVATTTTTTTTKKPAGPKEPATTKTPSNTKDPAPAETNVDDLLNKYLN